MTPPLPHTTSCNLANCGPNCSICTPPASRLRPCRWWQHRYEPIGLTMLSLRCVKCGKTKAWG